MSPREEQWNRSVSAEHSQASPSSVSERKSRPGSEFDSRLAQAREMNRVAELQFHKTQIVTRQLQFTLPNLKSINHQFSQSQAQSIRKEKKGVPLRSEEKVRAEIAVEDEEEVTARAIFELNDRAFSLLSLSVN